MIALLGFFFDNTWGKAVAAVTGLCLLVGAFAWDQRSIGGDRAIAKLNKIEAQANSVADRAADKSGAGGMRPGPHRRNGVRDPSTRDE